MISDGDRIAVGLSGGRDSLTLMWLLKERLARSPVHYRLYAIYIDPGFDPGLKEEFVRYCEDTGFDLRVEETDYGIRGHSPENRENPCFLCSRLRRKRIFEIAHELGCRKIALGHNKDDIIETFFLNVCYAGEISTMMPSQPFFKGMFTLIRPLSFAEGGLIRKFAEEQNFPALENPCPSAKTSKRRQIKRMLHELYGRNRKIKGNIFRALSHIKEDYMLKP